jgi:hypothetical protein
MEYSTDSSWDDVGVANSVMSREPIAILGMGQCCIEFTSRTTLTVRRVSTSWRHHQTIGSLEVARREAQWVQRL